MNSFEEVALAMYQEHQAQARQHEDQREKLTSLILVLTGALLAFVSSQKLWETQHLFLTVPVILLGVFGAVASFKHYERNRMHARIARAYRAELERSSGVPIHTLQKASRRRHRRLFPYSRKWRLYRMWIAIPIAVALVGFILSLVIILHGVYVPKDQSSAGTTKAVGKAAPRRP